LGLKGITKNGRGSGQARPGLWGYPGLAPGRVWHEQGSGAIGLAQEKMGHGAGPVSKEEMKKKK
jgi:hypothetical protein